LWKINSISIVYSAFIWTFVIILITLVLSRYYDWLTDNLYNNEFIKTGLHNTHYWFASIYSNVNKIFKILYTLLLVKICVEFKK